MALTDKLTNIADAIREKTGGSAKLSLEEMAAAISNISAGGGGDTDEEEIEEWVRPSEWQNLDLIDMTDFVGIYATYEVCGNENDVISMHGGTLTCEEITVNEDGTVNVIQEIPNYSTTTVVGCFDISTLEKGFHTFRITGFTKRYTLSSFTRKTDKVSISSSVQNLREVYANMGGLSDGLHDTGIYCISNTTEHAHLNGGTYWLRASSSGGLFTGGDYLEKIEFEGCTFAGTSLENAFKACNNLKSIDMSVIDMSNITSLAYSFSECRKLHSIVWNDVDSSKLTSANYMFSNCTNLKKVVMRNWSNPNLVNIGYMFQNCYNLEAVDLNEFNTNVCTSMAGLFSGCYSLKNVDISTFNTQKVTSFLYMFNNCYSLQEIDLSSFDAALVTTFSYMFGNCFSLQSINLSKLNTPKCTNFSYMFNYCYSLNYADISGFDFSRATNLASMFYNCSALKKIVFPEVMDVSKVTTFNSMFCSCKMLRDVDFSKFSTPSATNFSKFINGCYSLVNLDFSNLDFTKATSLSSIVTSSGSLLTLKVGKGWVKSVNITSNYLSTECLIQIMEDLPEVTSQTLTIGSAQKNRLTDEQIQVATDKGWTIA